MRHFLSVLDLTPNEIREVLELSKDLKAQLHAGNREPQFDGYLLTQIFEKPSLRTRLSFEGAIVHLGGSGIFITEKEAGLHGRESLEDVARVISGYSDIITMRTFSHDLILDFAKNSKCPVVNGLSDHDHPCQALTDILTMEEALGDLNNKHLVYVGDGNNVALSLAEVCAALDVAFTCSAPSGYEMDQSDLDDLVEKFPEAKLEQISDPHKAVETADVIYTDVWASMGQESEQEKRIADFDGYQINSDLMNSAPSHALFMHCLPAKRGLEVTDEVMESEQSIVFQQAENRMHLAKGLFAFLLNEK